MSIDCYDLENLEKERQEDKFTMEKYYGRMSKSYAKGVEKALFEALKKFIKENYIDNETGRLIKDGTSYSNRSKWKKLIKEKNIL